MSPRAACRLATLGFSQTYDYAAGKVDWLARNLPVEGSDADRDTIGRHLRDDVVTARITDPIGEVRDRVAHSAHRFALVTTEGGILLGRLRGSTLDDADPAAAVAEVMEPGPSTLRPHELAADVRARLEGRGLTSAIVTDPDGRLLGTFHPADLT
jgi:CBS domain-containing protein